MNPLFTKKLEHQVKEILFLVKMVFLRATYICIFSKFGGKNLTGFGNLSGLGKFTHTF